MSKIDGLDVELFGIFMVGGNKTHSDVLALGVESLCVAPRAVKRRRKALLLLNSCEARRGRKSLDSLCSKCSMLRLCLSSVAAASARACNVSFLASVVLFSDIRNVSFSVFIVLSLSSTCIPNVFTLARRLSPFVARIS